MRGTNYDYDPVSSTFKLIYVHRLGGKDRIGFLTIATCFYEKIFKMSGCGRGHISGLVNFLHIPSPFSCLETRNQYH